MLQQQWRNPNKTLSLLPLCNLKLVTHNLKKMNQFESQDTNTVSVLSKEIDLLRQKQELEFALSPQGREMQLIKARQSAEFALTPVGQELQRFETNQRMGQMYAASTLVPEAYRGNIANCAIAIDMATRMNANALMVMQNLYIVHGTPSWSSKFLISTINTCGRFAPLKFRFEVNGKIGKQKYWETEWVDGRKKNVQKEFDGTKIDNIVCIAYTHAKDNKDEILESAPVDCRLAVLEGWWTKNQSKWPTMTRQMLMYRAAAFWQRTYAPEISMGFNTVEETQDLVEDVPFTEIDAQGNEIPQSDNVAQNPRQRIKEMARKRAKAAKAAHDSTSDNPDNPEPPKQETEAAHAIVDTSSGEIKEITEVDLSTLSDGEYESLLDSIDNQMNID